MLIDKKLTSYTLKVKLKKWIDNRYFYSENYFTSLSLWFFECELTLSNSKFIRYLLSWFQKKKFK